MLHIQGTGHNSLSDHEEVPREVETGHIQSTSYLHWTCEMCLHFFKGLGAIK